MIFELDCGNSFIKWRVMDANAGAVVVQGVSASAVELLEGLSDVFKGKISRIRLVSVRGEGETDELCVCLSNALGVVVERASPSIQLGGVVNGYIEPQRLGMDRWLAMVGAFQLRRNAMMVIDLGTAVTIDFVDAQGKHLGGYITPGVPLLRHQLQVHTHRIGYIPDDLALSRTETEPGRTTAEAVGRGCLLMLRGFVSSQIAQATTLLGSDFDTYTTGGDAALIGDFPQVQCVPDLVFRGLAVACP